MPASAPLRIVDAPDWCSWAQEGRTFASGTEAARALAVLLSRPVWQQEVSASVSGGKTLHGFTFVRVKTAFKLCSGRQLSWRGRASVVIQDPAERAAAVEELQARLQSLSDPAERDATAREFFEKYRTHGHLPPRIQWQAGKFAVIVQLLGRPRVRIFLQPALADLGLAKECSAAVQIALEGVDLKSPPPDLQDSLAETVRPFQERDDGVWSNLVEGQRFEDVHIAEGCAPGDGPCCGEYTAHAGDVTEVISQGLGRAFASTITTSRARQCTEESCKKGARARGRAESQCDHLSKEEHARYRGWLRLSASGAGRALTSRMVA